MNSNSPSYAVAIQGSFTVQAANPPLGPQAAQTTPPQTRNYSVMTLVVDATTGQVTDVGLAYAMPDLSTLGPVTTDVSR